MLRRAERLRGSQPWQVRLDLCTDPHATVHLLKADNRNRAYCGPGRLQRTWRLQRHRELAFIYRGLARSGAVRVRGHGCPQVDHLGPPSSWQRLSRPNGSVAKINVQGAQVSKEQLERELARRA